MRALLTLAALAVIFTLTSADLDTTSAIVPEVIFFQDEPAPAVATVLVLADPPPAAPAPAAAPPAAAVVAAPAPTADAAALAAKQAELDASLKAKMDQHKLDLAAQVKAEQIKQKAKTERLDKEIAAAETKMRSDAAERQKDTADQLKAAEAQKAKQEADAQADTAMLATEKIKENGEKAARKMKYKLKKKAAEAKTAAKEQKLQDKFNSLVKERAIKDPIQRKLNRDERKQARVVKYGSNHLKRGQRRLVRAVKHGLNQKKEEVIRHIHTAVKQANELLKGKAQAGGVALPRSLHVRMPVLGDSNDDTPLSEDKSQYEAPVEVPAPLEFASTEMVKDAKEAFHPGAAKEAVAVSVATAIAATESSP